MVALLLLPSMVMALLLLQLPAMLMAPLQLRLLLVLLPAMVMAPLLLLPAMLMAPAATTRDVDGACCYYPRCLCYCYFPRW
jgi:hypothetical protein